LATPSSREEAAIPHQKRNQALSLPSNFGLKVQPLHSAAAAGEREIAHLLLDAGADPNARQEGGFTPLTAAEQNGDTALAALLREYGAED